MALTYEEIARILSGLEKLQEHIEAEERAADLIGDDPRAGGFINVRMKMEELGIWRGEGELRQ